MIEELFQSFQEAFAETLYKECEKPYFDLGTEFIKQLDND